MKIITDNIVYVQKNDLAYLNSSDLPIPASIVMKVFGNGIVIIDDSNRYEFIEFEKKEEIEYFKNLDWMIDYNAVKDLSEDEFTSLAAKIAQEQSRIVNIFNSMTEEEKRNNANMVSQCQLLEFKYYSLRDVFWFKQGNIQMELPVGVDYPVGYVKEKGVKKIFKSILRKHKKKN